MFLDFLLLLRDQKLKIGMSEWLTLMEALSKGLVDNSLENFYLVARSICCKSEAEYDVFDACFLFYFKDVEIPDNIKDDIKKWLDREPLQKMFSKEELQRLEKLDLDEVKKMFEQRLKEQEKEHHGGNRWVGTGGTSPFGHGGYHPSGIRVGGKSRNKSAMQIASKRAFRNYRKDRIIDTRQLGLALKKLHSWSKEGSSDELDIDASIEATGKNAGEIELVFHKARKNNIKLLLLLDAGGSMDVHAELCEALFSAAHSAAHLKRVDFLYFHNCPYEFMYEDMSREKKITTAEVLRKYDDSWNVIIVGDAAMNPYELTAPGGSVDYFHHNEKPGVVWLDTLRKHFPINVWLNPTPRSYWQIASTHIVRQVFSDMYPLSVEGLEQAIDTLRKKTKIKA